MLDGIDPQGYRPLSAPGQAPGPGGPQPGAEALPAAVRDSFLRDRAGGDAVPAWGFALVCDRSAGRCRIGCETASCYRCALPGGQLRRRDELLRRFHDWTQTVPQGAIVALQPPPSG